MLVRELIDALLDFNMAAEVNVITDDEKLPITNVEEDEEDTDVVISID